MDCCDHCRSPDPHRGDMAYRRVLWVVLCINATMFLIEIGAGVAAGSASLQADALDFFGDAANYAISLFVIGMALRYRAMAALAKGTSMGLFGLWIIETAAWHALHGTLPNAVRTITAVAGFVLRTLRISCKPSPSGMRTSVTTSGKRSLRNLLSASDVPDAVSTRQPSRWKFAVSAMRIPGSSSTINTELLASPFIERETP